MSKPHSLRLGKSPTQSGVGLIFHLCSKIKIYVGPTGGPDASDSEGLSSHSDRNFRKPKNCVSGEDGFSLIEIVVVSALLGILALGSTQLIANLQKSQVDVKVTTAARDLVETIHTMLEFTEICEANLLNRTVTPTMSFINIPDIKDAAGNVRFNLTDTYESNSLQILGIRLGNYTPITDITGRLDLQLELRKLRETGTVSTIYRTIPIFATTYSTSDTRIASCYAGGGGANTRLVCEEMGGRYEATTLRCLFEQLIVTNDPSLKSSPAMVHVRDSTEGDLFSVMRNGAVAIGTPLLSPLLATAPSKYRLFLGDSMLFSTEVPTATAGNAQGYIGADANNNDIDIGSQNPNVKAVALWNSATNSLMDLAYNRAFGEQACFGDYASGVCGQVLMDQWLNPAADRFRVFGDASIVGSLKVNGMSVTSDRNLKENIIPIKDSLDKVLRLRGVSYDWKQKSDSTYSFEKGSQIGLIAQELEEVIPELVAKDSEGVRSVKYQGLSALLIESVKEIWRTILEDKNERQALQERMKLQERQIQELRAELCAHFPKSRSCQHR